MKDTLLPPIPQTDNGGPEVTKNELNQSIVNSITNDEDDWNDTGKNGGNSIVNSVTNDEDDWTEPGTNSGRASASIQPPPSNYRSAFLTSSAEIGYRANDRTREIMMEDSRPSALPPMPTYEPQLSRESSFESESFLFRYEHMMREQETEQFSTLSHLQYLLELLENIQLEGHATADRQGVGSRHGNDLVKEFSFEDLKRLKRELEKSREYDVIKADKQFLMVLDTLCLEEEDSSIMIESTKREDKISWAEIVQCYRNCVLGMQTLQIVGTHATIRKRTKERTLAELSLYRKYPSPSRCSGLMKSKGKLDGEAVKSAKVVEGNKSEKLTRGAIGRILVSFITGMLLATLFHAYLSGKRTAAVNDNVPSVSAMEGMFCQIHENGSSSSMPDEFEVSQNILESHTSEADEFVTPMNQDTSTKKSVENVTNAVVLESDSSEQARILTAEFKSDFANKEQQHRETTLVPMDVKVINVLGGTATAITAILGSLPMGFSVMLATLAAHGIRDGVSGVWRKLHRKHAPESAVKV